MAVSTNRILKVMESSQIQLLADWVKALRGTATARSSSLISDPELQAQCQELITLLSTALRNARLDAIDDPAWEPTREYLAGLSRSRGRQGFSPTETAMFVLSLKEPLFAHLRRAFAGDNEVQLLLDVWELGKLLDMLALYTTEVHQQAREEVIRRQTEEMLELSTPVIRLWDGILAMPLIGTLDSSRTQVVMESLLEQIVATRSPIAILDITGVPTVDTLTAQHLLKTVAATRLMGAECIISGIRPQIAQTIVHLGVELGDVITKASLADAFRLALKKLGHNPAQA
ncbi:MAG: STAS domain-containing protein [Deltaproteobacteria bacterium]|nr:STAS domain-containing protein [Deltaproteobacteria bacterium]MCW5807414.1 STAS domain-containing protein [Deltaproteobacteria bacterium]